MKANGKTVVAGGVDKYIAGAPKNVQSRLERVRTIIRKVAPDAIETVSYFDMPGYSYTGYRYNGMFVWFSYSKPFIRLHVIPPVIKNFSEQLTKYKTTASVVSFPEEKDLPEVLIEKLVRASLEVMKAGK